ncbi:hypothetical protein SKAU_G00058830 [Synaphobranchus kaupii]|uniref:Uncharacterized protein n=1 Tax=Synaphobranchus kaupii TaxID=118154 RepID=A0A9Q1JA62_SYNKA|nr:hypothetical protein SKAU_G00058830 [Synaphobranchus kaupii]
MTVSERAAKKYSHFCALLMSHHLLNDQPGVAPVGRGGSEDGAFCRKAGKVDASAAGAVTRPLSGEVGSDVWAVGWCRAKPLTRRDANAGSARGRLEERAAFQ